MNEWIGIEDGLPDERQHVLAYIPDGDFIELCIFNSFHGAKNCFSNGRVEIDIDSITHWMACPIKPQIQTENTQ